MRVLITGSTGLVGSAIRDYLHSQGHDLVCLSLGRSIPAGTNIAGWQMDLTSPSFFAQASQVLPVCDVIVHAAASLSKDLFDPSVTLTNGLGTQQLLRLADHWQARSFIYLSSLPIIGTPKHLPITEDHPIQPPSAYHASKFYGELLTGLAQTSRMKTVTLRLSSPLGTEGSLSNNTLFYSFVRRALLGQPLTLHGKGTRKQNYVDVRDIAAGVSEALAHKASGLFHIGGERAIANFELAQTCVRVLSSKSEVIFSQMSDPDDSVAWDLSLVKANRAFGYTPQYRIEDSIKRVAQHYEHHGYQ